MTGLGCFSGLVGFSSIGLGGGLGLVLVFGVLVDGVWWGPSWVWRMGRAGVSAVFARG